MSPAQRADVTTSILLIIRVMHTETMYSSFPLIMTFSYDNRLVTGIYNLKLLTDK